MSASLATKYLGMQLRSPVVPSASPMGQRVETLKQLQDSGVGAVVLPSLFEEQIEHDEMQLARRARRLCGFEPGRLDVLPGVRGLQHRGGRLRAALEACKRELEIPVIASLNGISQGGWVGQARRIQEAGADALELNVYFLAADPDETADDVEMRYVKLVEAVRGEISIPLAVKIGPFFSSIGHMAHRLVASGADGLVLFNRFMQPDIDLEELRIDPILHLSTSAELLLPLRWIGILRDRIHASLALTTGAHTSSDVLKGLLVGADVVMMASVLLHEGPTHPRVVLA